MLLQEWSPAQGNTITSLPCCAAYIGYRYINESFIEWPCLSISHLEAVNEDKAAPSIDQLQISVNEKR